MGIIGLKKVGFRGVEIFYLMGWLGFVLFSVFMMAGPAIPQISLTFLLAYYVYWSTWRWEIAKRSSLFWLVWVFLAYLITRLLVGYWNAPETLPLQFSFGGDYLQFGGLWAALLAPWLIGRGGRQRLNWVLALAVTVFLVQAGLAIDWGHLPTFFGNRPHIVLGPNALAVISGVFLLAMLLVGEEWARGFARNKGWALRVLVWAGWLAVTGANAGLLLITQSRSAWLAILATMPLGFLAWFLVLYQRRPKRILKEALVGVGTVSALALVLVGSQWTFVEERFAPVRNSMSHVANLEFSKTAEDSVGQRIRLYAFGLPKVMEKPLWGWSPGNVEGLIKGEGGEGIRHLNHIHNMHLEIALGLGLVGFFLFYGMVALSFREIMWGLAARRLRLEWGLFWVSGVVFVGLEGMFDTRFQTYEYGALLALFGAVAIACQTDRLEKEAASSP